MITFLVVSCLGAFWGIRAAEVTDSSDNTTADNLTKENLRPIRKKSVHLANLISVSTSIYSGGTPDGTQAFNELKKLGIQTIVSVDGAKPRVDLAKQANMRYIHIPIGYDGISDEEKATLAEVFSQSSAPYYFHCHHGTHRGPAALASALRITRTISLEEANRYLTFAGTSSHYKGLWKAVEDSSKTMKLPPPLPLQSTTSVSSMAGAMAQIDEIYDNLKYLKKHQWKPDLSKPDITPAHQSLMLLELLKEIPRTSDNKQLQSPAFIKYLESNTTHAKELEQSLRLKNYTEASKSLKNLKSSCIDCHSDFRD